MHCFKQTLLLTILLFFTGALLANSAYYGDQYLRENNYYEALKHYQLAWKEDPGSLALKNKIENCLLLIDAEASRQALLSGNYLLAKDNADELISKNKLLEAQKCYREIVSNDPLLQEKAASKIKELDNLIYLEMLGDFYFREGELSKAQETYEQLAKINPAKNIISKKITDLQKFKNNFLNAEFQLAKENYPAALKFLQENKKINPDHLLNNDCFLITQIIIAQQKKNNQEFSKQKLALLAWPAKKELALKTAFNDDQQQEEIYIVREIIAWRQQGLISFELKKYREAQANFARVLSYSPNDKIALLYYKKAGELIN